MSAVRRAGRRTQLVGCVVTAQLRVNAAWSEYVESNLCVAGDRLARAYTDACAALDASEEALEQYELDATVAA